MTVRTSYLNDVAVWLCVGKNPADSAEPLRCILVGRYSRSGATFTIQREYSADRVGSASGYGYDRQGTALANSLSRLYGMPQIDGAVGQSAVIEWAAQHGIRVATLGSALWELDPIQSAASVAL